MYPPVGPGDQEYPRTAREVPVDVLFRGELEDEQAAAWATGLPAVVQAMAHAELWEPASKPKA